MSPGSCEEMERRTDDYLDGELPPAEARAVTRHLASCPECAARVAFETLLFGEIRRRLGRTAAPSRLVWRTRAALRAERARTGGG